MTKYNYSLEKNEHLAFAVGRDFPISTKHSIEICSHIRGMTTSRAKAFLENVLSHKEAVPFKRFNDDVGHKPGIGPGRYPEKAAQLILKLLNSVEGNAKYKNLDANSLTIVHASAQMAARPMRYGRHSRREAKRSHIEIAVKEAENKPKETKKTTSKPKSEAKKPIKKKTESKKPAVKKEEPKKEEVKDDKK